MEGQWTTVGKRTSNKVTPAPQVQKSPDFIESVRTNEVYSKRQFTSGLTAHRTTEPVYAKGSVFSSRLRNEVEMVRSGLVEHPTTSDRIHTSPIVETRNTTEFQSKASPYKNAAIKALDREKAAVAAKAKAYTADVFPVGIPVRFKASRPQTAPLQEDPECDEGFDDSDAVVHIRRKRVQPTEKFQTISHVTTIHKSAIDIIEPDDNVVTEFSEPHESNYE
jgi:hypothetical protein